MAFLKGEPWQPVTNEFLWRATDEQLRLMAPSPIRLPAYHVYSTSFILHLISIFKASHQAAPNRLEFGGTTFDSSASSTHLRSELNDFKMVLIFIVIILKASRPISL